MEDDTKQDVPQQSAFSSIINTIGKGFDFLGGVRKEPDTSATRMGSVSTRIQPKSLTADEGRQAPLRVEDVEEDDMVEKLKADSINAALERSRMRERLAGGSTDETPPLRSE